MWLRRFGPIVGAATSQLLLQPRSPWPPFISSPLQCAPKVFQSPKVCYPNTDARRAFFKEKKEDAERLIKALHPNHGKELTQFLVEEELKSQWGGGAGQGQVLQFGWVY